MAVRRGFRRAAVRRPTFWEGAIAQMSLASGGASVATIVSEANLEAVPNGTIVRVRGSVLVQATAAGAVDAESIVNWGIMLVNAPAFAAGIASLPTPRTDIGSDWLAWGSTGIHAHSTAVAGNELSAMERIEVDSKAMRKVGLNQVLVFTAEDSVITSTIVSSLVISLRVLFKR